MIGDLFLIKKESLFAPKGGRVFVPMIGDLFLITILSLIGVKVEECFRPHDWGSFFNL